MIVTPEWISRNYKAFNEKYWDGVLPAIEFKVNKSRQTFGLAKCRVNNTTGQVTPLSITISNYYTQTERDKQNTLLHEMIHIADYVLHPLNFQRNVRYDAHGPWFQSECARINKDGWRVTKCETQESLKHARLSVSAKKDEQRKTANARIGVLYGEYGQCFHFKTDVTKIDDVIKTINNIRHCKIGAVSRIEFYTFKNKNLALSPSRATRLRGMLTNQKGLDSFLKKNKAQLSTTIYPE